MQNSLQRRAAVRELLAADTHRETMAPHSKASSYCRPPCNAWKMRAGYVHANPIYADSLSVTDAHGGGGRGRRENGFHFSTQGYKRSAPKALKVRACTRLAAALACDSRPAASEGNLPTIRPLRMGDKSHSFTCTGNCDSL